MSKKSKKGTKTSKVEAVGENHRRSSAPSDYESAHTWRASQVAAEANAYADTPINGCASGLDVRPLLALVADAVACGEGAYGPHPDNFVSGALHSLAIELEVMHQALTHGDDSVVETAADMAWRLAERVRAVAEIASRIREVHAPRKTDA